MWFHSNIEASYYHAGLETFFVVFHHYSQKIKK